MISLDIKGDDAVATPSSDYNTCPSMFLGDDQCAALGFDLKNLPKPGTLMLAQVQLEVREAIAAIDDKDKAEVKLYLRVTQMGITDSGKAAADVLYKS